MIEALAAPAPPTTAVATPGDWWWLSEFRPYTWLHVLTSTTAILFMAALAILGARWRRDHPRRERILRSAWAASIILFALWTALWWLLPRNFDIQVSLPLHICDLAMPLAAAAMLTSIRWLRALLYFWAIGLSTQAFVTPILAAGVAEMTYWLFWLGHTQIVGSAIYDIAARNFRPTVRDLATSVAISLAYLAIIFPVDWAFSLNYGYVGPVAPDGTIVTALGPWPQRVPIIAALAIAAMILAWLPWAVARRIAAHARAAGSHAPRVTPQADAAESA
jgi:hypothetical integral membrane protein (TIGR02206 family)